MKMKSKGKALAPSKHLRSTLGIVLGAAQLAPLRAVRVAAFLVSDLASYITGVTLAVDGGMLLYPDFRQGG